MSANRAVAVIRGLVAGAVGMTAMDALWYLRFRRGGGHQRFWDWELSAGTTGWDDAGAPAQVGRKVAQVFGVVVPDSAAAATNTAVHWATGLQWGALYGLIAGTAGRTGTSSGAVLGTLAFSTSYVVLPLIKVYKPIWQYDVRTLWDDYSAHVVFGVTVGGVYRLLARAAILGRDPFGESVTNPSKGG